jgi:hypothetical protein
MFALTVMARSLVAPALTLEAKSVLIPGASGRICSLKLVPARVHLTLFFFLGVVQPVFFMQEKLAAVGAFCHVALVGITGVVHKLVVAAEFLVALFAFVLVVEKIHGRLPIACAKKVTEK